MKTMKSGLGTTTAKVARELILEGLGGGDENN